MSRSSIVMWQLAGWLVGGGLYSTRRFCIKKYERKKKTKKRVSLFSSREEREVEQRCLI